MYFFAQSSNGTLMFSHVIQGGRGHDSDRARIFEVLQVAQYRNIFRFPSANLFNWMNIRSFFMIFCKYFLQFTDKEKLNSVPHHPLPPVYSKDNGIPQCT